MLKVLLIDDDDIVLLVQRKLLQRCGIKYEILSYKGGKPALNFLSQLNKDDEYHYLILLDINMPHMNGWEFLSKLANLEVVKRSHVIMVTSSIDRYDKESAEEYSSVIDFIEKPITGENCEKIKTQPALEKYF